MELGFVSYNQEALNRANKVMKLLQGQPRQEELLDMLESQHLDRDKIKQLLFNLSPIAK